MAVPRGVERAVNAVVNVSLILPTIRQDVVMFRQPPPVVRPVGQNQSTDYNPSVSYGTKAPNKSRQSGSNRQGIPSPRSPIEQYVALQPYSEPVYHHQVDTYPIFARQGASDERRSGRNTVLPIHRIPTKGQIKRFARLKENQSYADRIEKVQKLLSVQDGRSDEVSLIQHLDRVQEAYLSFERQTGMTQQRLREETIISRSLDILESKLGIDIHVTPGSEQHLQSEQAVPEVLPDFIRINGRWVSIKGEVSGDNFGRIWHEIEQNLPVRKPDELILKVSMKVVTDPSSLQQFINEPSSDLIRLFETLGIDKTSARTLISPAVLQSFQNDDLTRNLNIQGMLKVKLKKGDVNQTLSTLNDPTVQQLLSASGIEWVAPIDRLELNDKETGNLSDWAMWWLQRTGALKDITDYSDRAPVKPVAVFTGESMSPNVKIAVLDTGYTPAPGDAEIAHWVNPHEIPDNKIDDDGDGYVDNVDSFNTISGEGEVTDYYGHGTFISNQLLRLFGNEKVEILPIKVCEFGGCYADDIIEATAAVILAQHKWETEKTTVVVNMSFSGPRNDAVHEAVEDLIATGNIPVSSAGNNGRNIQEIDPASISIAAGAVGPDGPTDWSGFGDGVIWAPGVDIISRVNPGQEIGNIPSGFKDEAFRKADGTSFASPIVVAGAVEALIRNPSLSFSAIRRILLESQTTGILRLDKVKALAPIKLMPKNEYPDIEPVYLSSSNKIFGHWAGSVDLYYHIFGMTDDAKGNAVEIKMAKLGPNEENLTWFDPPDLKNMSDEGHLQFDSTNLDNGQYVARVRLVDQVGDTVDELYLIKQINNSFIQAKDNWPVDIGYSLSPPLFSDGEIIISSNGLHGERSPRRYVSQGMVYFLDKSGEIINSINAPQILDQSGQEQMVFNFNFPLAKNDNDVIVSMSYSPIIVPLTSSGSEIPLLEEGFAVQAFNTDGEVIAESTMTFFGPTMDSMPVYSATPSIATKDGSFIFAVGGAFYEFKIIENDPTLPVSEGRYESEIIKLSSDKTFLQTDNLVRISQKGVPIENERFLAGPYVLDRWGNVRQTFPGIPGIGRKPFFKPDNTNNEFYFFGRAIATDITGNGINERISIVGYTKNGQFANKEVYLVVWNEDKVLMSVLLGNQWPDGLSAGRVNDSDGEIPVIALADPVAILKGDSKSILYPKDGRKRKSAHYSPFSANPRFVMDSYGQKAKIIIAGSRALVLSYSDNGSLEEDVSSPFNDQAIGDLTCHDRNRLCVLTRSRDDNVELWFRPEVERNRKKQNDWLAPLGDQQNSAQAQ